jgi:nitrite reductase/ring-hydroxylating ferredoxin subunit
MPVSGTEEECFLINFRGEFHAYINRCRHVPMAMDWVDNQFFAEQGRYLICQTHCAYYEPATGECIAGPQSAYGKHLFRVPVEVAQGSVYAREPEGSIERGL